MGFCLFVCLFLFLFVLFYNCCFVFGFLVFTFRFMHIRVLPACMYVHMCKPGAHRSQDSGLDPLELELWMVVSYHVGAENGTWVVQKSN